MWNDEHFVLTLALFYWTFTPQKPKKLNCRLKFSHHMHSWCGLIYQKKMIFKNYFNFIDLMNAFMPVSN